jgi:hypothetical protein
MQAQMKAVGEHRTHHQAYLLTVFRGRKCRTTVFRFGGNGVGLVPGPGWQADQRPVRKFAIVGEADHAYQGFPRIDVPAAGQDRCEVLFVHYHRRIRRHGANGNHVEGRNRWLLRPEGRSQDQNRKSAPLPKDKNPSDASWNR